MTPPSQPLDLAQIHLRRGKTAEVLELALATMEVLRAQKVAGGFLAASSSSAGPPSTTPSPAELVRSTVREIEKVRGGE
jgi:hypothetical protein